MVCRSEASARAVTVHVFTTTTSARLIAVGRPEPARLQRALQRLGVDLVQPATEGGEGDGRHQAATASRSCPQAAPMSSPLLHRTVVVTPAFRRSD